MNPPEFVLGLEPRPASCPPSPKCTLDVSDFQNTCRPRRSRRESWSINYGEIVDTDGAVFGDNLIGYTGTSPVTFSSFYGTIVAPIPKSPWPFSLQLPVADLTRLQKRAGAAFAAARLGAYVGGGLLLPLTGCSSGVACTNDLRPALLVSVVDESAAQVCDVMVSAEGPGTNGPRRLTPTDCRFSGETSAGHYVIVVSREGQPLVTSEVTVDSDECGVVTKEVKLTVPAP